MSGETELESSAAPGVSRRPDEWRARLRRHTPVFTTIAVGGGLGALARYGLAELLPPRPGQFPWATFLTNILGCLLIGVLMALIVEMRAVNHLVRPFFGIGFLGGFTTFSTYAVEIRGLLQPGTVEIAFAYLAGTLLGAMLAVTAGVAATRALFRFGAAQEQGA